MNSGTMQLAPAVAMFTYRTQCQQPRECQDPGFPSSHGEMNSGTHSSLRGFNINTLTSQLSVCVSASLGVLL